MRFQSLPSVSDAFKPGTLTSLAEQIYAGKAVKDIKERLTLDQFAHLPSIYGCLDPTDLDITTLEDGKLYKTSQGKEVLGSDIKAITMLMYDKPRSAYVNFGSVKQVHQSMYSGGVPIPMLAFKRFRNIAYDKWRTAMDDEIIINTEDWTFAPKDEDSIRKAFKVDMLLGKTLASTYYDSGNDTIKWKDKWGLLVIAQLTHDQFRPNLEDVQFMRAKGMGAHKGHFATAYGTARIDNAKSNAMLMYNKCDTPLRLMLAQRWIWYGNHRSDDMICDFQNWDNVPKKVDHVENVFTGLQPKEGEETSGIGNMFGFGR